MKKIIFASQDPSSGNTLASIVKKLKGFSYQILGSNESKSIYRNEKIEYLDADAIEKIEEVFDTFTPDLVITGASMGETVERKAVRIARKRNIPSISILDFWVNYRERYSNLETGEKFSDLPDYIFVMDSLAEEDMIKLGFPSEKLIVTGNPYFDSFKEQTEKGEGWLYVSNPDAVVKEGKIDYVFNPSALKDLIEFLDGKEKLLIRPHPKDNVEKFRILIEGKKNILIDSVSPIQELVKKHMIVIGMYTTILLQAALYGKIVIHYMPNSDSEKDDFICKRLNICHSVYTKKEFFDCLRLIREGVLSAKEMPRGFGKDATKRTIKEIERILEKKE